MAANAPALLQPDEPGPVRVLRDGGTSDFVLLADHAGKAIPRRLGDLGVSASERERHIAWDIGIAGVTELLADALDATAILQTWSRLVIDCNRDPAWESAIPAVSEHTAVPGNVGLTNADRAVRIAEIFTPYHNRIEAVLDARAAAGRRTIAVAMHSFTPVYKGESREVEIGVLYLRRTRIVEVMLDLLRAEGDIVVGENVPYALTEDSDYSVPYHAERRGLEHIEIEIRQDLITSPEGQAHWASRFARILTAALPHLG